MIQKILKLGGEDYLAEDLRRDLIKMEIEDKREQLLTSENGTENEDRGNKSIIREDLDEEQSNIIQQIISELGHEDQVGQGELIASIVKNETEHLGI